MIGKYDAIVGAAVVRTNSDFIATTSRERRENQRA